MQCVLAYGDPQSMQCVLAYGGGTVRIQGTGRGTARSQGYVPKAQGGVL